MGWFSSLVGGVVGFFVGGPVGAVIGAGLGATKVGEKVVNTVIDFVVQPFMGILGIPDIPKGGETERQQGVLVTRRAGGATDVPVIYGLRKVGGIITFAETGPASSTPANKYLWVVYVLSEGPVEGLYELYIDDNQIDGKYISQLNGGNKVTITDGKFANRVQMIYSKGQYYNTPSSSPVGTTLKNDLFKDCPRFTNTMVHNGLSCLFVRYEWLAINTQAEADANPFSGSIPEIGAVVLGRQVASLVTSASESYEYGAAGYSERYSTNPAEILLDYLRNPRYGKGMKNSEIDWDSWRVAAAKCNTEVTYTTSNIKGPILTCNYVLDTSYTIFQNTKILLQGFRAYMPYVQGKYKLRIEDAGNPTDITSGSATIVAECVATSQIIDASLLDNTYEIMGDVVYTGIDRSNKYNQVVVTYVDPRTEQKWSTQQVVYPETEADRLTFVAADGGRENKLEITMPTVTNWAIAKDFARILFNKSRYAESATLRVSSHAFELEPGDNIRIQSRILNFGDVPWRVIAIQHNENYTFDLGCVRNPDFIYPYTRVGEPDRVLPIYVPKGATVYYPKEVDKPDISLVPPTSSNSGGGSIGNPNPTDPTTGTGGGVGGPGGSTNTGGVNDTPPTAPKPQPLEDTIDITNIEYVTINGLIYARCTTKQPAHPMYSGVNIYYTSNAKLGYQIIENTNAPGAGVTFTIDVGPLAVISSLQETFNTYTAYFRVKYSTGEFSTKFFSLQFNPATKLGAGTNPSELVQIASSSWPSITPAVASATDNRVDIIRVLVPAPQNNPRTARIELSQDVRTQAINYNVVGVNVYAKSAAETYWEKTSYTFTNYSPGSLTSFAYTGFLGSQGAGINGSIAGAAALYTFVFRLVYADGSESTQQWAGTGYVETPSYSASTGVNIFYGIGVGTDPTVGRSGHMSVNDLAITLEPAGSAALALNTKMSVDVTFPSAYSGGIGIVMFAPDAANRETWQGVRVRYRAVVAGTNPAFTTQDFKSSADISVDSGLYTRTYNLSTLKHDTRYEMVITPLVFANGQQWQESNFSSYGVGYVSQNYSDPLYPTQFTGSNLPNWAPSWRWQSLDTGIATNTLNKTFNAANPLPSVTACIGYREAQFLGTSTDKQYKIREYISLTYDCSNISGFQSLAIYRRSFAFTPTNDAAVAKYWGIGRWERVTTSTASGTINLRLPTGHDEFDNRFGVSGFATTNPNLTRGALSTNGYPTGTAADNSANTNSRFLIPMTTDFGRVQLLLVVTANGSTSNTGLLIRGQSLTAGTGASQINLLQNANGQAAKPIEVVYNSSTDSNAVNIADSYFPDVGGINYRRKISDARTTQVSVDDMIVYDAANGNIRGYRKLLSGQTRVYDYTLQTTLPGSSV